MHIFTMMKDLTLKFDFIIFIHLFLLRCNPLRIYFYSDFLSVSPLFSPILFSYIFPHKFFVYIFREISSFLVISLRKWGRTATRSWVSILYSPALESSIYILISLRLALFIVRGYQSTYSLLCTRTYINECLTWQGGINTLTLGGQGRKGNH